MPRPRFGLCCIFANQPIAFRTTTARALSTLTRDRQLFKLSEICLHNALNLRKAVGTVHALGIGAFRIVSQLWPRFTHPAVGYSIDDLPDASPIRRLLAGVNRFRRAHNIRLSFHPDQFIVLNSPNETTVNASIAELEYHAAAARLVGADVINIHAGGIHGDKQESLRRFAQNFRRLSPAARKRLSLENDDVAYTPSDLLPLCAQLRIPLVYDVHHHRCNPDGLSIAKATRLAAETWRRLNREPYFHLSSPKHGWDSPNLRPHADYIDPADIPRAWRRIPPCTIDIEAKSKELAILKIMKDWPE
jgi:UV DNA damage endonuclease